MQCSTAGGAIRDLLLGRPPKDYDFVFHGKQEEFIQIYPEARKTGKGEKSIFICHGQEFSPLHNNDPQQDVMRRDFTINALLLSDSGILYAHPESFSDLKNRVLRPVSPHSLENDPVRLFRAARLHAAFPDLQLHGECLAQMRALPQNSLESIAPERIGAEVLKMCASPKPGNFLSLLAATRTLSPWFIELDRADTIPAGPLAYHSRTVLGHTERIMNETADLAMRAGFSGPSDKTRALAVWMALCHDLGKTLTPHYELPHHYAHEKRGGKLAESLGKRLRLPNHFIKAGRLASALHMKAGMYQRLRPGTQVDLLLTIHKAGFFTPFFLMVACDSNTPGITETARRDLEIINRIHLPEHLQNKGEISAARLREMRCASLRGHGRKWG